MRTQTKIIVTVLVLAVLALGAYLFNRNAKVAPAPVSEQGAPISIEKKDIKENNFSGTYPVITGTGALADAARKYVDDTIAAFRTRADTEVPAMKEKFGVGSPPATYELDIDANYLKGTNTEAIVFQNYEYTGGANGMSTYESLDASIPEGKLIALSDVIKEKRKDDFATLVRSRLMAWRPEGADAPAVFEQEVGKIKFASLSDWSMDDENLTLYFDKYEVGPGALGPVAFPLPLEEIRGYLNEPYAVASTPEGIEGCYVSRLAQDVYTLRIDNEENGKVTGFLSYKNYQKDSSSGPLDATYDGDTLIGDYSFYSEGMFSVRQVIFKKAGDSFIQGYGPVEVTGNREHLTDPSKATFDPKQTFRKEACSA